MQRTTTAFEVSVSRKRELTSVSIVMLVLVVSSWTLEKGSAWGLLTSRRRCV